jgi:polyisoprenoid-binding protein YceI
MNWMNGMSYMNGMNWINLMSYQKGKNTMHWIGQLLGINAPLQASERSDPNVQQDPSSVRKHHMNFANSSSQTPHFARESRRVFVCVAATLFGLSAIATVNVIGAPQSNAAPAKAAAAKIGGVCKKAGTLSGDLVCTKKASRLVWAKSAGVTTPTAVTATPTATATATKPAPAVNQSGIAGSWNATQESIIGYRVKEILDGQSTEAAGRTNAVSGTLVIEGTTAKSVSLVVDVTKLESDKAQRDKQVQNRILDTQKFPTAKLVLKSPIDFGKIPADKEIISLDTKLTLTIKAATRDLDVPIKARRVGATLEITGSIPIKWGEWGIENPSLPPFVTTDDNGILEFLVVFAR